MRHLAGALGFVAATGRPWLAAAAVVAAPASGDLTELTLDELANLKVVSVEKRPEPLRDVPAAVWVLTNEEVVASGATTLPALLRRAPGVHVARLDASQWAIGIRGFTNSVARSQLALMDGRSLYTPLFAGTYWDVQNVFLEDLAQVEIVRGPGGTLWGANAVNGVVNIMTRNAQDTQGGLIVLGGGNQERAFGRARYGGRLGPKTSYRVHGLYFDRAAQAGRDGDDGYDAWHLFQGGFRADSTFGTSETLTLQADAYSCRAGRQTTFASYEAPYVQTLERDADLSGGYLRGRWTRSVSEGREVAVQAYYDRTDRREPHFGEERDTFDVDAQVQARLPGGHDLVAGLGYRISAGRTSSVPTVRFVPAARTDNLFTAFVQDTFLLARSRLRFTLGTKVERNEYSGFELQPSARLTVLAGARQRMWAAVTRAVRTPTRFDRDLALDVAIAPGTPAFARLLGDEAFETERSLVVEAGYRAQLTTRLSLDVTGFWNRYPNLVSYEPGPPVPEPGRIVIPLRTANGAEGEVGGIEVSADLRPASRWLVRTSYSYLNMDVARQLGSSDTGSSAVEDASPRHLLFVSSSASLPYGTSLDASYRWVARLPSEGISAYAELDLKLAWHATARLEIALVGQDLLHPRHAEFGSGAIGGVAAADREIRRSLYARASLRW